MPLNTVQITYEAVVRGADQVRDLSTKTAELGAENAKLTQTVSRVTAETNKSVTAGLQARRAIIDFRKEMFAASFVIGSAVLIMRDLAQHSDALAAKFEKIGDATRDFKSNLGDAIASLLSLKGAMSALQNFPLAGFLGFGAKGAQQGAATAAKAGMSRESRIQLLGLQGESASLRGDTLTALLKKQEAERIKLLEGASASRRKIIETELLERQRLERETYKLSELGLKRLVDIQRDFTRGNISIFKGGISEAISGLATNKFKSKEDIMGFVGGIGNQFIKNAADMIAEAIATKVFSGQGGFGDLLGKLFGFKGAEQARQAAMLTTAQTQEKLLMNSYGVLQGIQNCVCAAASYLANMGSRGTPTISISGGKGGGALAGIGAIAGLVGAVAGAGAFAASSLASSSTAMNTIGGAIGEGGATSGSHYVNIPGPGHRSGGWIPSFQQGGEVPAFVTPGEFVVNKTAAAANKDILEGINSGNKPVKGSGGHVFLIKANDAQSFADQLSSPSSQQKMEIAVMKAVMSNGQVRKIIRDFAR